MKKLLILGGSRNVIPAIEAAHHLGVHVITCDYLPDNVGHAYSDEYYNVSIIDKAAVLELSRNLKIDGIISFATDPGVLTASYVAEKLGLPTSPYKSVEVLQNKDLFREFLKKNKFNVPKAKGFNSINRAKHEIEEFSFPVMVKPVDSAGSKGVTRVNAADELDAAIKQALLFSHHGRFIIEEFIEKNCPSSDTDCFSVDDELVFTSFNCQYFDEKAENPYTPAAYMWPSEMPEYAIKNLTDELQRLIKLLNMGTSIYNVETRLGINGEAYIMEMSPRAGGNRLAEVLHYATGQNLILNSVKAALGMHTDKLSAPVYNGIWAECILHADKAGSYGGIEFDNDFKEKYVKDIDMWVKKGDCIRTFTGANETIGTVILKFNSIEKAKSAMENTDSWMRVSVL